MDNRRATRRSMAVVASSDLAPIISSGDDDPSVTDATRIVQPPRRITTRARSRQPSPAAGILDAAVTVAAVAQPRRRSISMQKESPATIVDVPDDRRNLAKRRGRPPAVRPTMAIASIETILESSSEDDNSVVVETAEATEVPRPQTPVERLLRAVLPSPRRNTPTPPPKVVDTPQWSPRVMLRSNSVHKRTGSNSPSIARTESPFSLHDPSSSADEDIYDDDNASINNTKPVHIDQPPQSEFGGQWGSLLWLIFLPPAAIYLQTSSLLTDFTADFWTLVHSFDTGTLPQLPVNAVLLFAVFRVLHMALALCKVGRRHRTSLQHDDGTRVEYFFETGASLGVCLSVVCLFEYFGLDPLVVVQRQYVPLCCVSVLHALGLSVRFYALRVNRSSGCGMWAVLFNGADLVPERKYAAHVSDKLVLHRMAVNGAFVLNAVLLTANAALWATAEPREWTVPECVQHAAEVLRTELQLEADVVSAVCAALVCVDMMVRALSERQLSASFEMNGERVGAQLLLRYALSPFAATLMAKQAFEQRQPGEVPEWALAAMATVFVVGLVVRQVADCAKWKWSVKQDIANIDGAYLENGGWGKVRHPNYVGEILCTLALCLPLYWRFVPQPLLLALFHCACLVHRSGRIQRRMVNNDVGPYAAYRARVPRRLVPGIF